jgi:hypothetical protein
MTGKLRAKPQLQVQAVQPLLSYAIDSSFLMLARRDGSDGTGLVEPEDLVEEVAALFGGVCSGEADMFEEVVGLARRKMSRDGVAYQRDTAPPGSILNAQISGFWLTMDLLDVDNTTPAGKILPVLLQLLFHKGRLALHGKKIENFIQSDFD